MKIEFELPDNYKNDKLILCLQDSPSLVEYLNIYEKEDVWIKIKDYDECPLRK